MKVSIGWLKKYVHLEMSENNLAEALTMAGLEVDAVADRYDYLNHVLVGRIVEVNPLPDSDLVKLCAVDIGHRAVDVVCAAPNIKQNMLVPCALPGACLPQGRVIEKSAVRGKISEGMLCSEIELGLGTKGDGLMELTRDLSVGAPLNQALGLTDKVFEIDLTPNRPDCLSIIGIAREVAGLQKTKLTLPEIRLPESFHDISGFTSVTILDPHLCPRYAASLVFDVRVGPSPFWLQDRLLSVGLKPINNIVDITNFVMMETGQPLHAFDFDRLAENRIVVRVATEGETFITLDGREHRLDPEMLMICDGEKPVALAGVMGGLNSEIEDDTTRVLLESAYFDPFCIRKTSKKTGLNTDASHRFERGVDPNGTVTALTRATQLITEIVGGKLIAGIIDAHPNPAPEKTIALSVQALNRRLGTHLNERDIGDYLKSIEFEVEKIDDDLLQIRPPSCRVDINRLEDLSEEIARLYGYNNIETTFPLIPAEARQSSKRIELRNRIKHLMTGLGFVEAINYSFISKLSFDRLELEADDPKRNAVAIANPLSEEQAVMRTSLIPGLLETMKYNLSVLNKNLKLFEIGNVFFHTGVEDSQPEEVEMLSALWTGIRFDAGWLAKEVYCDFYDLKGVVEELLRCLDIVAATFTRIPPDLCNYTKPGYSAWVSVANKRLGLVGELHPNVLRNYDLKQPAFIFELNFDQLIDFIPDSKSVQLISKFPPVTRDITLIIETDIEALNILKSVEQFNEPLVENLHLFDVFEGDPIPPGKKSISFRITYRSSTETLEDESINQIHKTITNRLVQAFDAGLPGR